MDKVKTPEDIDHHRRRFFGAAAMTFAAAQFGTIGSADAQPGKSKLPSIKPQANKSFGPLKQIDAGFLSVGYAEAGSAGGPPSFCCTDGPTTSTVTSTLRPLWLRRAIG
jgi:hypothetical protein